MKVKPEESKKQEDVGTRKKSKYEEARSVFEPGRTGSKLMMKNDAAKKPTLRNIRERDSGTWGEDKLKTVLHGMKLGQVAEKKRKFGEGNWGWREKQVEKDEQPQPSIEITIHEHGTLKNETGTEIDSNPMGDSNYDDECGRIKRLKRNLDQ